MLSSILLIDSDYILWENWFSTDRFRYAPDRRLKNFPCTFLRDCSRVARVKIVPNALHFVLEIVWHCCKRPLSHKIMFLIKLLKPEILHPSYRWLLSSLEWSRSPKWIFHFPRSQTYWWTLPALRLGCPPVRIMSLNKICQDILNMKVLIFLVSKKGLR